MNLLKRLKQQYTYAEIAEAIRLRTGRKYNRHHLTNVANGFRAMSDGLRFNLMQTYPDIFLQYESLKGVVIAPDSEQAGEEAKS